MIRKIAATVTRGSALLEVLITMVILAFGLLGIAGLQARVYTLEFESYQRAQAVVVLNDLAERIGANPDAAAAFIAASPLGGVGSLVDCSGMTGTNRDACELGNLLRGSGERSSGAGIGGMDRALACITAYTASLASEKAFSRCQTGVQIDVIWRGRSPTIVPGSTCGTTGASPLYAATDAYRRAVSVRVGTGDTSC